MKVLKVIELFAGVGGFRLGLEKQGHYQVVWSNQWEPSTKTQHASMVYEARFGKNGHSNENIADVPTEIIPDADVLVGGFPCQDYSVATTLQNSKGLIGKKGVLWWQIHRILKEKEQKPNYLLLENVDRLLKSPSSQRGRDFALMLKSLDELGYAVEWRVVNAAEYGLPQRRKRIFILGYLKGTALYDSILSHPVSDRLASGVFSEALPVENHLLKTNIFTIEGSLSELSEHFNRDQPLSPFFNSGVFINGHVFTAETKPKYHGDKKTLGDILEKEKVAPDFYIENGELHKWEYLKGSKKEVRTAKNGHQYHYSEGGMTFPDDLEKASRTIITGEGGRSPSRFKHVVPTANGLRRLTPIELERLNMFPDDHTKLTGISETKRAFFMGNALVVGVVEKIGEALYRTIQKNG